MFMYNESFVGPWGLGNFLGSYHIKHASCYFKNDLYTYMCLSNP